MRILYHRVGILAAMLLCSCNGAPTGGKVATPKNEPATTANYTLRLPTPDLSFRLGEAERKKVQPRFDVNALEKLLGMMQPDQRAYVLSAFEVQMGDTRRQLTQIGDPVLQAALGDVWRPILDKLPTQVLKDPAIARNAGVKEELARRDTSPKERK